MHQGSDIFGRLQGTAQPDQSRSLIELKVACWNKDQKCTTPDKQ
jgi:hypothetical protein